MQTMMHRPGTTKLLSLCVWSTLYLAMSMLHAEDTREANVSVRVRIEHATKHGTASMNGMGSAASSNIVVWLTSAEGLPAASAAAAIPHEPYRLVQKNKQFTPHLLVVPTGSNVEFPNLDPFFHNVFSLFNGKRFDLGLYEAGSRRSVRFDREGVSYIFCNIHPEMGAVVVSLSTPYYAVPGEDGIVAVRGVPAGIYRLHVWAEDVSAEELQSAERQVRVEGVTVQIGEIHLTAAAHTMAGHKNKFGDDYKPTTVNPY